MQLPVELKNRLDELSLNVSLSEWARAFQQLSDLYRNHERGVAIEKLANDRMRAAYAHVRLPATYAAVMHVLEELRRRLPELFIASLADVGSGPGTGVFAAAEIFSGLKQVSCYERDGGFITLSQKLLEGWKDFEIEWIQADVTQDIGLKEHDLVLASYALNELGAEERFSCIERLWKGSGKVLVIVEPGTPRGFEVIREVRKELISLGASIVAPCPHQKPCPMGVGDWCHFSARVERSRLHRQMKGGALNYEDEKFSYVIASRGPGVPIQGRILRHPQKKSGFVVAEVCGATGIQQVTTTRKSKEMYRQMRKAEWGDSV